MQIRPLKLEEIERWNGIVGDAFVTDPNWVQEWAERDIKPHLENTRVLVTDDGEIVAALRILYPRLWLGDGNVPMAGISAVATPPENRRQGSVKRLLIPVLKELREAGYNNSTLYPFYFPFYKKFGYEQASTEKTVTIKTAQLQKFKPQAKGRWKEVTKEQWAEFNAIYEQFCKGRFGHLTRDESWWQWRVFTGPQNKPRKLYLWYNEQGEAQAYVVYSFHTLKEWEREMRLREIAWVNLKARHEIMAFLANHDSQAVSVSWKTNPEDDIFALLDDPREAEMSLNPGYMLRVLDAARALEERSWPQDATGTFSLAVRDDLLEWNNTALQVEVSEGKVRTRVIEDAAGAGLSCDVRQLAQLYAGYISPYGLAGLGLLEVRNRRELAEAQNLFSPPGQIGSHMNDFF